MVKFIKSHNLDGWTHLYNGEDQKYDAITEWKPLESMPRVRSTKGWIVCDHLSIMQPEKGGVSVRIESILQDEQLDKEEVHYLTMRGGVCSWNHYCLNSHSILHYGSE